MEIFDHSLQKARQVLSPNHSERPKGTQISLLVIHSISLPPGEYGGCYIDDFFCNQLDSTAHVYFEEIQALTVSSHLLIQRNGEIVQYVPFNRMAWHAGVSNFQGRVECNEFSIGIELEGTDTDEFTDEQYNALSAVSKSLLQYYPELLPERIVGHCDIAPGRKTDPGSGFDWSRYHLTLNQGRA